MREKLLDYSLNLDHDEGGPKARGFASILGIDAEWIGYLEAKIRCGIRGTAISGVRIHPLHGVMCVVEFPLQGVGSRADRSVNLRTVWRVESPITPPRLVSAFLKP